MKTMRKITFFNILLLLTTFCSSDAMEPLKKTAQKAKDYCGRLSPHTRSPRPPKATRSSTQLLEESNSPQTPRASRCSIQLPQELQYIIFEADGENPEKAAKTMNSIVLVNQDCNQRYNNLHSCILFIKKWAKILKTSDFSIVNMLKIKGFRSCRENQSILFSACSNLFDECPCPLQAFLAMKRNNTDFGFTYHSDSRTTGLMLALNIWVEDPITELIAIEQNKPGSININHQDTFGNTALLYCLNHSNQKNCIDITQKLLNAGANPTIANNKGLTPLTVAQKTNNLAIITLIEKSLTKSPF